MGTSIPAVSGQVSDDYDAENPLYAINVSVGTTAVDLSGSIPPWARSVTLQGIYSGGAARVDFSPDPDAWGAHAAPGIFSLFDGDAPRNIPLRHETGGPAAPTLIAKADAGTVIVSLCFEGWPP